MFSNPRAAARTALLVAFSLTQGTQGTPGRAFAQEAQDPRTAELRDLSADESRAIVSQFKVHSKATQDPAELIKLLEELSGEGRHDAVSKELTRFVRHRKVEVRLAALRLLGTQRDETAQKALLAVLKRGRKFSPVEAEEAARSLGHTGYGKRGYQQLEELFYAEPHGKLRRAIVRTFGQQKEKQAVPLLIALLDQPKPGSVNSASNPPASYWQQTYKKWRLLNPAAVRALAEITGRRFVKAEDAIAWVEAEGKKIGIKYKRARSPW